MIRYAAAARRDTYVALLFLFALLLSLAPDAWANNPEWTWRVVGGSPTFNTKAGAVTYLRSKPDQHDRYAKLTIEKRVSQISDAYEYYEFEAPKITPEVAEWRYQNASGGGPFFASEAELVSHLLSNGTQSSPGCPQKTLTPIDDWHLALSTYQGWGGNNTQQKRFYNSTYYRLTTCNAVTSTLEFRRTRSVVCPAGYSGEHAAPGCHIVLTGRVYGTLHTNACVERGNPCDASSGSKHEIVLDYEGPDGLRFERHYHSRSLDATNQLGVGWTHNYQARVVASLTALQGLIRPDGYRESVRLVSTAPVPTYVSVSGTGIIAKKISASQWQVFNPDGSVETYHSSGVLESIRNGEGRITSLEYEDGHLVRVKGPFGHTLDLRYDSYGRLSQLESPSGEVTQFAYADPQPDVPMMSNLESVTYADQTSDLYHYEDVNFPNNLTGITRGNGVRFSTYAYDTTGRAVLTERAGGANRHEFTYAATTTIVTDPLGQAEALTFTADTSLQRRLVSSAKAGITRSYVIPSVTSDFQRRPSTLIDERGVVTKFFYSAHRLTSKVEADGTSLSRTTSYAYLEDHSARPLSVSESNRDVIYGYDNDGRLESRSIQDGDEGEGRTWTYTHNNRGQTLTVDGPRTDVNDVTTYTYYTCTTGYQCGQVHTITNALGHVTIYTTYNAHGQPLTITDPNGIVTTLTYDLRQRLTSRTVDTEVTTFDYWPTGLLKKATLPDGSYLSYTYDAAHRLTDLSDAEGNTIHYTLDAMGNRTSEELRDPSNTLTQTRTRVFNTLNQLWKEIGAAGGAAVTTTFGYDNNGNQTSIAAPLGRSTGQSYDELNRLTQITDPATGLTKYGYNALDQLISVTDPRNKVTSYTYNALGDLTQQVSPDTGTTTHTYDPAGNLKTRTDARGKTGTYGYDALNRVTSLTYPDQTLGYTYDQGTNATGRLSSLSDGSGSTGWSYDSHGRVTAKQQTTSSLTKTLAYGYDSAGRLQSLTLPSGNAITYGYTHGKVTSLTLNGSTTILHNVLYQPFGPTTGWTWGNSTLAIREYDQDGKVTDIDSAGLKTYVRIPPMSAGDSA